MQRSGMGRAHYPFCNLYIVAVCVRFWRGIRSLSNAFYLQSVWYTSVHMPLVSGRETGFVLNRPRTMRCQVIPYKKLMWKPAASRVQPRPFSGGCSSRSLDEYHFSTRARTGDAFLL